MEETPAMLRKRLEGQKRADERESVRCAARRLCAFGVVVGDLGGEMEAKNRDKAKAKGKARGKGTGMGKGRAMGEEDGDGDGDGGG